MKSKKEIIRNKSAISLIVLVITIIVMIVLAGAIILSLNNAGIIGKANQSVAITNEATAKELAQMIWADAYIDNYRGDELIDFVTEKLKAEGVTSEEYDIAVTDLGVEVTSKASEEADIQKKAQQIWSDAYTAGIVTEEDLLVTVLNGLREEGIETYLYDIIVTSTGVKVQKEDPEESTVQNLADKVWEDVFIDGERTIAGLTAKVYAGLRNEGIDTELYIISVTTTGVTVESK